MKVCPKRSLSAFRYLVILGIVIQNAYLVLGNGLIRGLDPELHRFYQNSGNEFRCLDGSKIIPSDQINDGFCDCFDGTDEPGRLN